MRVIGMISGTSFDAVEALLAEFELDGDALVCDLVEHRSVAYPPSVRHAISAMLPPSPTTIEQVCQLDVAIGRFFGDVAKELADEHGRRGRRVFARPDRLPLGRRGHGPGHAPARRAGVDRRAHGRHGGERRPQPRHRRRRPGCAAGQPARRAAPRRLARDGVRLAQPRRHRQCHRARPGPRAGRLRHRARPTPSWTPPSNGSRAERSTSTGTGRGRPGATPTRRWSSELLDDPYFVPAAAQIDGQGVLQPRLRHPAVGREGNRGRGLAGVA